MFNYMMCPECYTVFGKSDIETYVMGIHKPECSEPKLIRYDKDRDEVIKELEEKKDWRKKKY